MFLSQCQSGSLFLENYIEHKCANTGPKIITEFVASTFECASADGLDIFSVLGLCDPSSVPLCILCNVTGLLVCLHLRLLR